MKSEFTRLVDVNLVPLYQYFFSASVAYSGSCLLFLLPGSILAFAQGASSRACKKDGKVRAPRR